MDKKLLFVVGAPRSGTTWVQLLLAGGGDIATVNETHLFSSWLTSLLGTWSGRGLHPRRIGISELIERDEWVAHVRRLAEVILTRIADRYPGAKIVMEKTPDHALWLRQIHDVFPDAYFLHIVRDPRSVVASLRAASNDWGMHWAASGIIENARLWRTFVWAVLDSQVPQDRILQIRYEDLKRDGADVLHKVFRWLDVATEWSECADIVERYQIANLQGGQLPAAGWDLRSEPERFFRRGETDSWRQELRPAEVATVEYVTGDLMETLGYLREQPRYRALRSIYAHKLLKVAQRQIEHWIRRV